MLTPSPDQERHMQADGGDMPAPELEVISDRDTRAIAPADAAEASPVVPEPIIQVRAAGILFQDPDGRVLFLKRGNGGDYPGYWCFPGGHEEPGETPIDAAKREAIEELGALPEGELREQPISRFINERVDFTTYYQSVPATFDPQVNGEHTGWAWAMPDNPPEPLHPGCANVLARMSADELGVARLMAFNGLESPQRYQNVWLFDIRVTGTGVSYRVKDEEFTWRDPSLYLNDEFLARCNGLPVIFEHPEKSLLTSEEYDNRNVGSVFLPYIKGDEVWAIAKIYDDETAGLMSEEQLSTSPAVRLHVSDLANKVELEDGKVLLIEGKPILVDHLAICGQGVWDKGAEPSGVRLDSVQGAHDMADEAEDKKMDAETEVEKSDADPMAAIADAIKGLTARMDAYEANKSDSEDKEEDKSDEEEKEAKADSVPAEILAQLSELRARIPTPLTDAQIGELAQCQAKADELGAAFGHAPLRAMQGETPLSFRRRLASKYREHSKVWAQVAVDKLDSDALTAAEHGIYADAVAAADASFATAAPGMLREVIRMDEAGRRIKEYKGSPSAWMDQFKIIPSIAKTWNVNRHKGA